MSKQEVTKLFEAHQNQWEKIRNVEVLVWEDFPWPMFKQPSSPEDLTTAAVQAYVLYPHQRAQREIREDIRKWHPDRFNPRYLSRIKESEKEKVCEGAGSVVRILNDLLHRITAQDPF
ncbi:hypothetical protein HYDPIDRAFT_96507 [Hydnomerulius pinastri MD-312]|uniref:Uncharacterized protein n=1 Tax=Hydnomerulius pinastri MD-312 TaxID=994086 RepID=A0A0C9W4N9_9AGAM|nr:hypothetical protein HYDPIDRAFT_96507 [Hydnomerulius pinastri MD-312]